MRILVLLLLLPTALTAAELTPKDELDIRTAIKEQAKIDNLKGTGEIWTERGPLVYRVRKTDPVTADVATADVDGLRTGPYGQHLQYIFIMARTEGRWTVARKIQVCPVKSMMQPVTATP